MAGKKVVSLLLPKRRPNRFLPEPLSLPHTRAREYPLEYPRLHSPTGWLSLLDATEKHLSCKKSAIFRLAEQILAWSLKHRQLSFQVTVHVGTTRACFFAGTSRHSRTWEPLRRLGQARDEEQQDEAWSFMKSLGDQLRQVARRLAHAPMFTVIAVLAADQRQTRRPHHL